MRKEDMSKEFLVWHRPTESFVDTVRIDGCDRALNVSNLVRIHEDVDFFQCLMRDSDGNKVYERSLVKLGNGRVGVLIAETDTRLRCIEFVVHFDDGTSQRLTHNFKVVGHEMTGQKKECCCPSVASPNKIIVSRQCPVHFRDGSIRIFDNNFEIKLD